MKPAAPIPRLGTAERSALLRKYRQLVRWRRARDAESDTPDPEAAGRDGLRELAEEFPGALRELDVLGLAELERRVARLDRAGGDAVDSDADAWALWIATYHRIMRAALAAKRALGKQRRPSAAQLAELTAATSALAALPLDEEFVRAIAAPPGGRIGVVVLRTTARHLGVPAATLSMTLFPPRRPSPYSL